VNAKTIFLFFSWGFTSNSWSSTLTKALQWYNFSLGGILLGLHVTLTLSFSLKSEDYFYASNSHEWNCEDYVAEQNIS